MDWMSLEDKINLFLLEHRGLCFLLCLLAKVAGLVVTVSVLCFIVKFIFQA